MNTAVFPGSFDPFTIGHQSIVDRAVPVFDKIIIAIGKNSNKTCLYDLESRMASIKAVYANEPKVEVMEYTGLTVDFCKAQNANFILRGLRNAADFEYERGIAQMNNKLNTAVDTYFLLTPPELSAISSTIVRDIIRNGGDASQFVPKEVKL